VLLTGGAGEVRLELRTEYVTWDEGDPTEPCTTEPVAELVTGTCDELEVIVSAYTKALPRPSGQN